MAAYPETRGITVTNKCSRIVESILKDRLENKLSPTQNRLQKGFTDAFPVFIFFIDFSISGMLTGVTGSLFRFSSSSII
jgi:uncharacterized MAPEG superfamily protein